MKTINDYVQSRYPIQLFPEEEGFVATIPDLPGCMSSGQTVDEAVSALDEAKRLWIQSKLDLGEEIPEPTTVEEYSGKFVLRIPKSLHRALDQGARSEGVSLNQHLVKLLSERQQIADLRRELRRLVESSDKTRRATEVHYLGGAGVRAGSMQGVIRRLTCSHSHEDWLNVVFESRVHESHERERADQHSLDTIEFVPKPPSGKHVFTSKKYFRKELTR